jgi:hypothetical protein
VNNRTAQTNERAEERETEVNVNVPDTPEPPARDRRTPLTPAERRALQQRIIMERVRRQTERMREREQRRRSKLPPPQY